MYEAKPCRFNRSPVQDQQIAGCFRICVPAEQYSTIFCVLEKNNPDIQILNSSGENYFAAEFVCGQTILTAGAEDDHPAFDTKSIPDGIAHSIHASIQQVVFGIAWADDYHGQPDVRTWFAADPTLRKGSIIMENYIIIGILLVIIVAAVMRAKKHFKGGGCCGSGSNTIREKKTLNGPKLGEKTLVIEGMHCENCEIRVENALNRLDGVVSKVNYKKKTAVVSYSAEVSDDLLKETVEKKGYKVVEIH